MSARRCSFCGFKSIKKLYTFEKFPLAPRSTKTPILDKLDFDIGVCEQCQLIQKTSETFTEVLYAEFKNDVIGEKLIRQKESFYELVEAQIKPNHKVVEMGSGNGEIIEKLSKNNPRAKFIANDFNLTLEIESDNLKKLEGDIHQYELKNVDIFFSSHVFEHIENVTDHILKIYDALRCGGKYIIALPLFEHWIRSKNLNSFSQEHPIYPFESDLDNLFFNFGFNKLASKEFLDHSLFVIYEKGKKVNRLRPELWKPQAAAKQSYMDSFLFDVEQLQQLMKEIPPKHKNIAIWGANTSTQVLISLLSKYDEKPLNLTIVDNSELKIGGYLFGTEFLISSPKVIEEFTDNDAVIVMLGVFDEEVKEQCQLINPKVKVYSKDDLARPSKT